MTVLLATGKSLKQLNTTMLKCTFFKGIVDAKMLLLCFVLLACLMQ